MSIKPLRNNIIFQFLDETSGEKGSFTDRKLPSGIFIPQSVNRQKIARWGKVLAVGPTVDGVVPGDFILIEALMWMEGVKLNESEKVWKTDDSKIICATNDIDACQPQAL